MGSVVIVVVEPKRRRCRRVPSLRCTAWHRPFPQRRAVESFDLAVGLRPERKGGPAVLDARAQGDGKCPGTVAGSVGGEGGLDADSMRGKEGVCPEPESGGGFLLIVGEIL